MELKEWMSMTPAERMSEVGTEPPCPYCDQPRVGRSDYIRCNPCGKNWPSGTDIFKHPHIKTTKSGQQEISGGAQPVNAT
jgi:ribosomal protein L37AE/L43A